MRKIILRWTHRAAIVFALLVIAFFWATNLNFMKEKVESSAADMLGMPVRVHGDVEPGMLGLRPALLLRDVALGAGEKPALTAAKARASLGVMVPKIDFLLRIKGLAYEGRLLGDYDVPVRDLPEGFEVPDLEGELEGAELSGHISYLRHSFKADLSLEDLSYGRLIEGAEGPVRGKLILAGTGRDSAGVIRTLDGSLTLFGGKGKLASKEFSLWTRDLLKGIFSSGKDSVTLNCAIVDFKIEKGVAVARALVFDTEEATVYGSGSIDLNSRRLNLVLKPKPKDAALLSLATPLRVSGPLDNPSVTPEAGAMVKKLGGLLLGAVNPAMALLPLIELGSGNDKNPCAKILEERQP